MLIHKITNTNILILPATLVKPKFTTMSFTGPATTAELNQKDSWTQQR
jgi:hypothetical protein